MTHLCYTLEEAAEKLNLSETVLVRLSQYFKAPKVAYEEVGYLSFKGDLAFSDQDIAFFQQVKERLLAGESLDEVKGRIRENAILTLPAQSEKFQDALTQTQGWPSLTETTRSQSSPQNAVRDAAQENMLISARMREIEDRTVYEQAAEKSFERYKSMHRTGLGRVFENMLKEVSGVGKKQASHPKLKPLRDKVPEPDLPSEATSKIRNDSILPFKSLRQHAETAPGNYPSAASKPPSPILPRGPRGQGGVPNDAAWEQIIQQAVQQPRTLNSHLKNAAALLRDRALGQSSGGASSQRPL